MTYRKFQQQALSVAARSDGMITVATATMECGVEGAKVRRWLDQMVVEGIVELDSLDDGTLCYRASGLRPRAPEAQRRPTLRKVLLIATILSVLDLVGVGVAALIVYPHWESEVLMWIALAGAPLTLVWIVSMIHRRVTPSAMSLPG